MQEQQNLAVLVRDRRLQLGLSLRQLETLSGVSRGRISQVESGQRRPGIRVLHQLAGPLRLNLAELSLAAGLPAPELPSIQPYLRAAYGFSAENAADVARYLHHKYGAAGAPGDGEDDLPDSNDI